MRKRRDTALQNIAQSSYNVAQCFKWVYIAHIPPYRGLDAAWKRVIDNEAWHN